MTEIDDFLEHVESLLSDYNNQKSILDELRKRKECIIAVVQKTDTLYNLKQKFPYLVTIDDDNAVFLTAKLQNVSEYVMVILKEGKLDAVVMTYDLNAKAISQPTLQKEIETSKEETNEGVKENNEKDT